MVALLLMACLLVAALSVQVVRLRGQVSELELTLKILQAVLEETTRQLKESKK